ncbi:MAG: PDZ domain-containing protein [Gammaproteobacteria bacterium]|nr:PDZ domain-containing protein [Gammaproteobacteria bacterium]
MKSILAAVVLSAGVAFAAAGYYFASGDDDAAAILPADTNTFDPNLPVEARIAALEKAVSDERLARQLLQEEVFYLTGELERFAEAEYSQPAEDSVDEAESSEPRLSRSEERRRRNSREGRVERLVAAGFLPSQADWITQREQELQMAALQERFDAERSGEDVDWMANRTMTSDTLRAELGDADYERYLEANDRSTNVSVSSVIDSSPAQTAGLMPGDEIVRYDGERVFSMTDLTRQTMVGEPGQTVVVDVMRSGNLMQIVMPRGPVGITGGRRRF